MFIPSISCHACYNFLMFLQLQLSCNLDSYVAYLAINYLHRFMSRQEIPVSIYLMITLYAYVMSISLENKENFEHLYIT